MVGKTLKYLILMSLIIVLYTIYKNLYIKQYNIKSLFFQFHRINCTSLSPAYSHNESMMTVRQKTVINCTPKGDSLFKTVHPQCIDNQMRVTVTVITVTAAALTILSVLTVMGVVTVCPTYIGGINGYFDH